MKDSNLSSWDACRSPVLIPISSNIKSTHFSSFGTASGLVRPLQGPPSTFVRLLFDCSSALRSRRNAEERPNKPGRRYELAPEKPMRNLLK